MRNPNTGIVKQGYYGFSWTYLFFGFWVPLFRGHYQMAMIHFAIWLFGVITLMWLPIQILMAFFFNKFYTLRLIEDGYVFFDDYQKIDEASRAVGVEQ
jgi:hypothetical protein